MQERSELPTSAKEKLCRHILVANTGAINKKPWVVAASLPTPLSFAIRKYLSFVEQTTTFGQSLLFFGVAFKITGRKSGQSIDID